MALAALPLAAHRGAVQVRALPGPTEAGPPVLHVDEACIVVAKPPGMLSVPGAGVRR